MVFGTRLLLFSNKDPKAASLNAAIADWGGMVSTCESFDELRGRIEGADYDVVVLESSLVARRLMDESSPDEQLSLPLAEVEKRHIMRVLSSTNGNKTKAAKILGIDTKTLYNKLKAYRSSDLVARKRAGLQNGVVSSAI